MNWEPAAAVIGAVTGVVSLLLLIFHAGRKLGILDTKVAGIEGKLIEPEAFGQLRNQVDTLYEVYVKEALKTAGPDKVGNPVDPVEELVRRFRDYVRRSEAPDEASQEKSDLVVAFVKEVAADSELSEYLGAAAGNVGVAALVTKLAEAAERER